MTEVYAKFVLEGGLDPEYVLDKMQIYEVRTLLKNWNTIHKESWEQTRWMTCMIMNMLSKNQIHLTDLIEFPWDEDEGIQKHKGLTDERMKSLMAMAKQFEKKMSNT